MEGSRQFGGSVVENILHIIQLYVCSNIHEIYVDTWRGRRSLLQRLLKGGSVVENVLYIIQLYVYTNIHINICRYKYT